VENTTPLLGTGGGAGDGGRGGIGWGPDDGDFPHVDAAGRGCDGVTVLPSSGKYPLVRMTFANDQSSLSRVSFNREEDDNDVLASLGSVGVPSGSVGNAAS
jgi:hypothetical protein